MKHIKLASIKHEFARSNICENILIVLLHPQGSWRYAEEKITQILSSRYGGRGSLADRVVSVLDLQSSGSGFEYRSGHYLRICFWVAPSSNARPRL